MLGDFPQHFGRHVFVRQLLEDLLAALADVSTTGENEGQRANRLGHGTQSDLVPGAANRLASHRRIPVVVCRSNVLIINDYNCDLIH